MHVSDGGNVLLVGGTGYLGRALHASLSTSGWRVTVVETRPSGVDPEPGDHSPDGPAAWRGEAATLRRIVADSRPDVLVVLAAHYVADHETGDIDALVDANVRLPSVILEVARSSGVRSLVMAGTYWEELSSADPVPADLYAATRCASKAIARFFADAYSLTVAWLRVSDIYGPRDDRPRLFSHLRSAATSGAPLLMSPGEQFVAPIHVDDAAGAFSQATRLVREGTWTGVREFGVQGGETATVREIVETYARVVCRPVPVIFGGRPYRDREVMTPVFLPPTPGWSPSYDIEAGIRDMERADGGLLAG